MGAKAKLEAVLAADDTDGGGGIRRDLALAQREIPNPQALERAERALARSDVRAAREALAAVSGDTLQGVRLTATQAALAALGEVSAR